VAGKKPLLPPPLLFEQLASVFRMSPSDFRHLIPTPALLRQAAGAGDQGGGSGAGESGKRLHSAAQIRVCAATRFHVLDLLRDWMRLAPRDFSSAGMAASLAAFLVEPCHLALPPMSDSSSSAHAAPPAVTASEAAALSIRLRQEKGKLAGVLKEARDSERERVRSAASKRPTLTFLKKFVVEWQDLAALVTNDQPCLFSLLCFVILCFSYASAATCLTSPFRTLTTWLAR